MIEQYTNSLELYLESNHIPPDSLEKFVNYLVANDYSSKTIHDYLEGVIHFARWQRLNSRSTIEVSIADKFDFLNVHLPDCHCSRAFAKSKTTVCAALSHWFREVAKVAEWEKELCEEETLIRAFDEYLRDVAGLTLTTRRGHCSNVKIFLDWLNAQSTKLRHCSQDQLTAFICYRGEAVSLYTAASTASALNRFIPFLTSQHYCQFNTALRAPSPKLPFTLPTRKPLSDGELTQVFAAMDTSMAAGKRNYAIICCLADLGLRVGEVANITLDDLDWRNAVVSINPGKSRRQHRLPLPNRLLEALTDYVTKGRPKTQSRHVFVCHRTQASKAIKACGISKVVRNIFEKAGIPASQRQPHRLRHTVATKLLDAEVPLKTIADVLGHKCINTTIQYAFVNPKELQAVAMPWPLGDKS